VQTGNAFIGAGLRHPVMPMAILKNRAEREKPGNAILAANPRLMRRLPVTHFQPSEFERLLMSKIRRDPLDCVQIVGTQATRQLKYRANHTVCREQCGGNVVKAFRHSVHAAVSNSFNLNHQIVQKVCPSYAFE
jgi:hypothetical protein